MRHEPPLTPRPYLDLANDELFRQCEMEAYRASGPGGQKRNKTSSAVRLRHRPTGLTATAEDDRSQHVNRRRALRRLRRNMALTLRQPIDPADYTVGAALAEARGPDRHLRISDRNPRYFAVVAEVLDLLAGCRGRVSDAARSLGLSTAGLTAFLCGNANVREAANGIRTRFGLKPLK